MNETKQQTGLMSNGYRLSDDPTRLGFLEPSNPAWPQARLREQYQAQGYLWLKGLLDRQAVLAFRHWYFEQFKTTGLLAAGSDLTEGIYADSLSAQNEVAIHQVMVSIVRHPVYEAFCQSRPLVQFYEAFLQGPVYLHRRKLIRYTLPDDPRCTGAHYDMVYLREGTDQFCSSWLPLGDIPVEMGGLTYLEGSHTWGQKLESQAISEGKVGWLGEDLPALADRLDQRWLVANYEAGDVLVHSPYIVHASTVNFNSRGYLRLSTDIRYQRASDPIDQRWTNHWSPDDNL